MAALVVDTCVWIDVAHGAIDLDSICNIAGPELIYVSAITLGELEFGAQMPNDPRERAERTALLRAVERMPVLEVTRRTAQSFGLLAIMMKHAGRNPRPRYNDLWIAAQAHEQSMALLTSNPDDFRALDVIDIIEAPKKAH